MSDDEMSAADLQLLQSLQEETAAKLAAARALQDERAQRKAEKKRLKKEAKKNGKKKKKKKSKSRPGESRVAEEDEVARMEVDEEDETSVAGLAALAASSADVDDAVEKKKKKKEKKKKKKKKKDKKRREESQDLDLDLDEDEDGDVRRVRTNGKRKRTSSESEGQGVDESAAWSSSAIGAALSVKKAKVSTAPRVEAASAAGVSLTGRLSSDGVLLFEGSAFFRQRLVLATLSGRQMRITKIRPNDESPGLRDYEANLLRLIDSISNGCAVRINESGTTLRYRPGLLIGGYDLEHTCPTSRSLGYFLEALVCLAPFCKEPLEIKLNGVTNTDEDVSVDVIRTVTLPLLRLFGVGETAGSRGGPLDLQIVHRGAMPDGGGQVLFTCPIVRTLQPVQLTDPGKVKRVRGLAYTTRVSPQMSNRVVTSARGVLNDFIPDVYLFTDHYRGPTAGLSPGFGAALVALSTNRDVLLSAQRTANAEGGAASDPPEKVGEELSRLLLQEIAGGGCIDSCHQAIAAIFMALCPEEASQIRCGPLTAHAIGTLRLLKLCFGVSFQLKTVSGPPGSTEDSVMMACLGIGYSNYARRAT